jgi:hypothetical protein
MLVVVGDSYASSSTRAVNIISSFQSMASVNLRTPRLQGGDEVDLELSGGHHVTMKQGQRKGNGGEVNVAARPIFWRGNGRSGAATIWWR